MNPREHVTAEQLKGMNVQEKAQAIVEGHLELDAALARLETTRSKLSSLSEAEFGKLGVGIRTHGMNGYSGLKARTFESQTVTATVLDISTDVVKVACLALGGFAGVQAIQAWRAARAAAKAAEMI